MKHRTSVGLHFVLGITVALLLALVDPAGGFLDALIAYSAIAVPGSLLIAYTIKVVGDGHVPSEVLVIVGVAIGLRLLVAVGLAEALPVHGYGTQVQDAGYVFQDAYVRDTDSWAVAQSNAPLLESFRGLKDSDQYGGLLFLSAGLYRYLSPTAHHQILIPLVATITSAISVLGIWGFATMLFGRQAGIVAALIMAIYPDYVLVSASHMREPFIIAGFVFSLFGYARMRIGDLRRGAYIVLGGILLAGVISPPSGALITAVMIVLILWERKLPISQVAGSIGLLIVIGGIGFAAALLAWISSGAVQSGGPVELVYRWLTLGADYQLHLLERGSGWAQKIFGLTPGWAHLPLATVYGLSQPSLPAAIADHTGAWIWQVIGIYRGTGWFLLVPLLIYGSIASLRGISKRWPQVWFAAVMWLGTLLASYRAAGDQWDNPRYRLVFLGLQAAVGGWAWHYASDHAAPWLKRCYLLAGMNTLILLQWYLGRYIHTPRLNFEESLLTMSVATILLVGTWLWRDRSGVANGLVAERNR